MITNQQQNSMVIPETTLKLNYVKEQFVKHLLARLSYKNVKIKVCFTTKLLQYSYL